MAETTTVLGDGALISSQWIDWCHNHSKWELFRVEKLPSGSKWLFESSLPHQKYVKNQLRSQSVIGSLNILILHTGRFFFLVLSEHLKEIFDYVYDVITGPFTSARQAAHYLYSLQLNFLAVIPISTLLGTILWEFSEPRPPAFPLINAFKNKSFK